MKARLLSITMVVLVVPMTTGCGHFKGLLFGHGAPCNACTAINPGYTVNPPAYGGPAVGCGVPGCGAVQAMEPGCGGETFNSYYGGIGSGYPVNGQIIGETSLSPMVLGEVPYDGYNVYDGWSSQGVVVDDQPAADMAPLSGQ